MKSRRAGWIGTRAPGRRGTFCGRVARAISAARVAGGEEHEVRVVRLDRDAVAVGERHVVARVLLAAVALERLAVVHFGPRRKADERHVLARLLERLA